VTGNPGSSTVLGTGVLNGSNSVAITSTTPLSSGTTHHIWAAYAGNTNFAISVSGSNPFNVTTLTAVSLGAPTVTPSPVPFARRVTFTGSVTALTGANRPTGTLSFCIFNLQGVQVYCTPAQTLTGSGLTSTTQYAIPGSTSPILPGGSYTVRSVYMNNDGNFQSGGTS